LFFFFFDTSICTDTLSFFILSVAILVTGVRLFLLLRDPEKGGPALAKLGRKSSSWKLSLFVGFVFVVLFSRAVVELLRVVGVVDSPNFGQSEGFSWKAGVWFVAFIVWEVVPIGIFIVSYWPASSSGELPGASRSSNMSINNSDVKNPTHKPIHIREVEPLLSSNLFANPARYDSDGEDPHAFDGASGSMYSPYFTNSPQLMIHGNALNKSIN
jgi:hypothetical protein